MIEKHTINFGSLLVSQIYTALVDASRKQGGELDIRMNFILDEFANFTKIDTFQSMLTVSRGRNIRFVICLQSFAQIEERYGKEGAQNIMDNCAWIYLKTRKYRYSKQNIRKTSEHILHKVMVKVVIQIISMINQAVV